ncbi:MAG: hypothetical protein DMF92_00525 [Acidobacteria bacterium]|nr:MAG: hypothetical protein DMF92_00525 [Acidobacteriota bacterium]
MVAFLANTAKYCRACEKMRRSNAELAERAEKFSGIFFSAASAVSALNVICSQSVKMSMDSVS